MTPAEIVDHVARHLLRQGRKACAGDGVGPVRYRAPNGDCCAIGCLIPDEAYSPALEGLPVENPAVLAVLPFPVGRDALRLLVDLQLEHDAGHPPEWKRNLRQIGWKHRLPIPSCLREEAP